MKNILFLFLVFKTGIAGAQEEWVTRVEEEKDVRVFNDNGKYGIKNFSTGEILLPAQYSQIDEEVVKDHFVISTAEQLPLQGVYNSSKRKMIVPPAFSSIKIDNERGHRDFNNDSLFVMVAGRENKYGLLDHEGKVILSFEYSEIRPYADKAWLEKDKKTGIYFFNKAAKDQAIPVEFDEISIPLGSRYLIARRENKYSLFDPEGNLVSANNKSVKRSTSRWLRSYSDDFIITNTSNKTGVFEGEKKILIVPVKYDLVSDDYDNNFIVSKKGRFGVVGENEKIRVPLVYDTLAFLKPKKDRVRLKASKNHKYALVDISAGQLSQFLYHDIEDINGGFYKVKLDGGYTVIDSKGNPITRATYDHIGTFYHGECAVFKDGKMGYMNVAGKLTVPVEKLSRARGYTTLESLFRAFVTALRSDNDSLIMEFCRDVVVDEYTLELMRRIPYDYRKFPGKISSSGLSVEDVVKDYYKEIDEFRKRLKAKNLLKTLTYSGLDREGFGYWNQEFDLLGTESRGVITTGDKWYLYEYKLGELIYLDGYWKSFTGPRD